MKIKVDESKIPSLYSNNNNIIEGFYYEKLDNDIDNIIYELANYIGNNYVVTGYRGAGKTTFVKFIENKISNNDHLFVFIDYPLSKGYYVLLKKIIRNLYICLEENDSIDKEIKNKLKDEMEELYISTFADISNNTTFAKHSKISNSKTFEVDIYSLIIYLISFVSITIGILFVLIENILIASIVFAIGFILNLLAYFIKKIKSFSNLKYIIKNEKNSEIQSSLNIKKYYDDDISEQHLKNIIKSFSNNGIKITFVIDELDKIEKESEINEIINSIKPLLLSGMANFIIISGQSTLYQIYNGKIESDKVINSLFSREIHIPLFSKTYFQKIVENIIVSENITKFDNEILRNYTNHLIVKSNKNIRKFIINFKNSINWSDGNNNSFIELNNNKIYKNETKILEVIDLIETKNIQYQYIGIRDYLVNQLFIWVNKIYIKGEIEFKLEDIINEAIDENHCFIYKYQDNINFIGQEFFKNLVSRKILSKDDNKYKLSIEVESNPNNIGVHSVESIFFDLYRTFESIVNELQNIFNQNESKTFTKRSIIFLKEKFNISINDNIRLLRNKIVHGEKTSEEDFIQIAKYVADLPGIITNIIEHYTFNLLEEYFEKKGFESHLKNNYGKELDATHTKNYSFKYSKNSKVINIDIKYNNFEISNHLESFKNNEYYIFIFYYDYKKYNGHKKIQSLNKIIENQQLDKNVFLINNSENRWIINPATTTAYIDKYCNIIENSINNTPITKSKFITGYKDIDKKIKIYPKEIILLASHPIELSSSLLLNIYLKNLMNDVSGLYISNNSVKERMVKKIESILTETFYGQIEDYKLDEIINSFMDRILFNITSPEEIIKHITPDINYILIDNIQAYCSTTKDYDNFLQTIKQIGIKYNLPVILSSHIPLNKLSSRPNKHPIESDISNYSSNLFNLSSVILTLYKEEYYDEFTEHKGVIEVEVKKGLDKNNYFPIKLIDKNGYFHEVE